MLSDDQYDFLRYCLKPMPFLIVMVALGFLYSIFWDPHPQAANSIAEACLLLFMVPVTIILKRKVDQYEKAHFHSKDKENDSSDSSDSDASPKT